MSGALDPSLLDVSRRIGQRICDQALWNAAECTWQMPIPVGGRKTPGAYRWQLANSSLYNGNAGIGLFLARLYALTKEPQFLRTAVGAIEHAVKAEQSAAPTIGFYLGSLGIAYSMAHIAIDTGRDSLLSCASALLNRIQNLTTDTYYWDYLSGAAGAIPALLALARMGLVDEEFPVRLGEWMLSTARSGVYGISWLGGGAMTSRDLCGLAHGAAGPALACMELYLQTGEERWRHAAESAVDYERSAFDESQANWLDLREQNVQNMIMYGEESELRADLQKGDVPREKHRCVSAWCHGAAGIALCRLRAFEIAGGERMRREALIASEATLRSMRQQPTHSVCHGVAGNAEVLRVAANLLHEPRFEAVALELAYEAAAKFEGQGRPWPTGGLAQPDVSLMMGEAGIGLWYMQLSHGEEHSVLRITSGGARKDPPGVDPSIVARAQRIERWYSNSFELLRRVSPRLKQQSPENSEDGIVEVAAALDETLNTAPSNLRSVLADGIALEVAATRAAHRYEHMLFSRAGRRALGPNPHQVDWSSERFVLAPEVEVVVTERDWTEWNQGAELPPVTAEPHWYVVTAGDRDCWTQQVGPFAGALLSALREPSSLEEVVAYLKRDLAIGSNTNRELQRAVREQLVRAYAAGLIVVAWLSGFSAPESEENDRE